MAACYQINGTTVVSSSRQVCGICCAETNYMQTGALVLTAGNPYSPVAGGLQYCSDGSMYYSDGSQWKKLGSGGGTAKEIAVDGAYGFFDMRECMTMCRTTPATYSYGWPFSMAPNMRNCACGMLIGCNPVRCTSYLYEKYGSFGGATTCGCDCYRYIQTQPARHCCHGLALCANTGYHPGYHSSGSVTQSQAFTVLRNGSVYTNYNYFGNYNFHDNDIYNCNCRVNRVNETIITPEGGVYKICAGKYYLGSAGIATGAQVCDGEIFHPTYIVGQNFGEYSKHNLAALVPYVRQGMPCNGNEIYIKDGEGYCSAVWWEYCSGNYPGWGDEILCDYACVAPGCMYWNSVPGQGVYAPYFGFAFRCDFPIACCCWWFNCCGKRAWFCLGARLCCAFQDCYANCAGCPAQMLRCDGQYYRLFPWGTTTQAYWNCVNDTTGYYQVVCCGGKNNRSKTLAFRTECSRVMWIGNLCTVACNCVSVAKPCTYNLLYQNNQAGVGRVWRSDDPSEGITIFNFNTGTNPCECCGCTWYVGSGTTCIFQTYTRMWITNLQERCSGQCWWCPYTSAMCGYCSNGNTRFTSSYTNAGLCYCYTRFFCFMCNAMNRCYQRLMHRPESAQPWGIFNSAALGSCQAYGACWEKPTYGGCNNCWHLGFSGCCAGYTGNPCSCAVAVAIRQCCRGSPKIMCGIDIEILLNNRATRSVMASLVSGVCYVYCNNVCNLDNIFCQLSNCPYRYGKCLCKCAGITLACRSVSQQIAGWGVQDGAVANCNYMFVPPGAGAPSICNTWINPCTCSLVMLRAYGCVYTSGMACPMWVGAICWDLVNCCVARVDTIYPGVKCGNNGRAECCWCGFYACGLSTANMDPRQCTSWCTNSWGQASNSPGFISQCYESDDGIGGVVISAQFQCPMHYISSKYGTLEGWCCGGSMFGCSAWGNCGWLCNTNLPCCRMRIAVGNNMTWKIPHCAPFCKAGGWQEDIAMKNMLNYAILGPCASCSFSCYSACCTFVALGTLGHVNNCCPALWPAVCHYDASPNYACCNCRACHIYGCTYAAAQYMMTAYCRNGICLAGFACTMPKCLPFCLGLRTCCFSVCSVCSNVVCHAYVRYYIAPEDWGYNCTVNNITGPMVRGYTHEVVFPPYGSDMIAGDTNMYEFKNPVYYPFPDNHNLCSTCPTETHRSVSFALWKNRYVYLCTGSGTPSGYGS